ncbi:hypothetical protein RMATCC62417_05391 [Rhizopus microsporus]|nr:hypothetical protein RMATCC62417_05391 [Rhizopus microsporus]
MLDVIPFEILFKIASYLDISDIDTLCSINKSLSLVVRNDLFWKCLCYLNGVSRCFPDLSWKELYCSIRCPGNCPHLAQNGSFSTLEKKRHFWSLIRDKQWIGHTLFCLDPSCDFVGDKHTFNEHHPNHFLAFSLTQSRPWDLWCSSCSKMFYCQSIQPIEETMVKAIYSYYLIQDHPDMNYSIVEGRRSIERRLYRSQTMREPQHIIEKHWYDQWTNFIYGADHYAPDRLDNSSLFGQDGSLKPDMSFGTDFELITSTVRDYITRAYGFLHEPISIDDLRWSTEHCRLIHSVNVNLHFIRSLSPYPVIITENQ